MDASNASANKRVYQIDFFRFIAAIGVVLFHYMYLSTNKGLVTTVDYGSVGSYFRFGYLGVDLFFIISGFVISLSISSKSVIRFISSRISRLYPAYWVGIILTTLFIVFFGLPYQSVSVPQFLANLTMIHSFFGYEDIDPVYWTLFVELKFYVLIGIMLIFSKVHRIFQNDDLFIYLWTLLTLVAVVLNVGIVNRILNAVFITEWSSYFIAGMIFYKFYLKKYNYMHIICLVICYLISLNYAIDKGSWYASRFDDEFSLYTVVFFVTLFYGLMFLVSIGKLQFINKKIMIKLGLLTYPIYLIHQEIGYIILERFGSHESQYIVLIMLLVSIIIISFVINDKIEKQVAKKVKSKVDQLLQYGVKVFNKG